MAVAILKGSADFQQIRWHHHFGDWSWDESN
jgi:hypothetical protein